jgi:nucleotide-binding universal stress UspA family protein
MSLMVMVPLDGSAFAERALPTAALLAARLDAELQLVMVRPTLPLGAEPEPGSEYLQRAAGQIEVEPSRRVSQAVLTDELGPLSKELPPADTIGSLLAGFAASHGATLIIMTTHGRGGLRRAWLGSVTDALIRVAPCPVLTVPPDDVAGTGAPRAEREFRHILLPLDGSPAAERAVAEALRVGAPFGARYTLLRVVSPLTWEATPGMYGTEPAPEALGLSRQAAVAALERTAARLRASDVNVEVQTVMASAPGAAIVEYATDQAADLIAMSTTGEGGVRRLLLGSTADAVVRAATVPVLVCNAARLKSG